MMRIFLFGLLAFGLTSAFDIFKYLDNLESKGENSIEEPDLLDDTENFQLKELADEDDEDDDDDEDDVDDENYLDIVARTTSQGALTNKEMSQILKAHNKARMAVSPTAANMVKMRKHPALMKTAAAYAKKCQWAHNPNRASQTQGFSSVGENLYETTGQLNVVSAVNRWIDEKRSYNFNSRSCSGVCGHYTQVVWATSKYIGCGSWKCPNGRTMLVCDYGPAGNYVGQKPYISGRTCSKCPKGCKNKLCK